MAIAFLVSYPWLLFLAASVLVLLFFKKDYYFVYNHRLLFVFGLMFSHSLTNYAIISVIIWYFTEYGDDLVMSAILSNIQGSLSSLFVIFMARAADSYVGRFHTLLFSNTSYIGGLMLLWLFNPYDVKWLVVISLVLLALGKSGANLLQVVLENLVIQIDRPQDQTQKTRSLARATIWSRIAYVSGAISAILWVAPDAIGGVNSSWRTAFMICIFTMTVTLIVFCKGHNVYHQGGLIERPLMVFLRVCYADISKLLKCTSRFLKNAFLRQDRSARNVEIDTEVREEDMVVVKSLLRIFPMWGMFFVVALISATGNTFFLQQFNNLNSSSNIVVQIYYVLQDFSCFAIPFLYRWICKQVNAVCSLFKLTLEHRVFGLDGIPGLELMTSHMMTSDLTSTSSHDISAAPPSSTQIENPNGLVLLTSSVKASALLDTSSDNGSHENEMVKIGVGMLCGITSCIMAWQVEVYRLKKVNDLVDKDANTSMSFLWLVPQFCVLGFMEGLTREGLLNFYTSQVTQRPLNSYGEEYIEIVLGLGKLLSIFFILIFQSQLGWFGDTINHSRLDKYYVFLALLCTADFIIYCCIARFYYKDSGRPQNLANENLNQDDHTERPTGREII